jgi:hypothetical protein
VGTRTGGRVQVKGVKQLAKDLREFEGGVAELKDANQAVGKIVVAEAQRRAPRVSGRLARSTKATRAPHRVKITGGGARVPYAGPIHWGWPARNIRAQPFVTDAAYDTQPQWLDTYRREITRLAAKVKGGTSSE